VPPDIESLRDSYFLRGYDSDFATGRRSHLVYALPSQQISFTHLNLGGPEPLTYLEYARRDITGGTQQGAINALGHAKRAVHLVMDKLLEAYCLDEWVKAPFPVRAELLRDIGAFPTRLVSGLNHARNLMEHDYSFVEVDRAADFVELVELFLTVGYPFFQGGTIGAYVGTESDTQCTEWFIEPRAKGIAVADIAVDSYLDLPIGRVHYNMQRPREATPRFVVPLTRSRQSEWMPYLDLLVYCTRRQTLRLPQPRDRGSGVYHHHHDLHFPPDAKSDRE
jgi:hypothetical protein